MRDPDPSKVEWFLLFNLIMVIVGTIAFLLFRPGC